MDTPLLPVGKQASSLHLNHADTPPPFPAEIKLETPSGTVISISVQGLQKTFTLKELQAQLIGLNVLETHEAEIELLFDGKSYPLDTQLEKIHTEIDLSRLCIKIRVISAIKQEALSEQAPVFPDHATNTVKLRLQNASGNIATVTPSGTSASQKPPQKIVLPFFKDARFKPVTPVDVYGVSKALGVTTLLMINRADKTEVTKDQALKGNGTPYIECTKRGMRLHFTNCQDAQWHHSCLFNQGYPQVYYEEGYLKNEYGTYVAHVTIPTLLGARKYIENSCGYPASQTVNLFSVKRIRCNAQFFVEELELIGQSTLSLKEKHNAAKRFIEGFLPLISDDEVNTLSEKIKSGAATAPKGKPISPLQYLREIDRLFFSSYSDESSVYRHILHMISDVDKSALLSQAHDKEMKDDDDGAYQMYYSLGQQGNLEAWLNCSRILLKKGQYDEAIKQLEHVANFGHKATLHQLADIYREGLFNVAKDEEKAQLYLTKASAQFDEFEITTSIPDLASPEQTGSDKLNAEKINAPEVKPNLTQTLQPSSTSVAPPTATNSSMAPVHSTTSNEPEPAICRIELEQVYYKEVSYTQNILYQIGNLFNQHAGNLIAQILGKRFHSHNITYHPMVRILLLNKKYTELQLGKAPRDWLTQLVESQKADLTISYDQAAYNQLDPLLQKCHVVLFDLLEAYINAKQSVTASEVVNKIIDAAYLQIAQEFPINSLHLNQDVLIKLVTGELLGILHGTNLPALFFAQEKRTTLITALKQYDFFEFGFYQTTALSLDEQRKVHLASPALTQSPLRDETKFTPTLPRKSANKAKTFHRFSHPTGLEIRETNTVRGDATGYFMLALQKYQAKLENLDQTGVNNAFDDYFKNDTHTAYKKMVALINQQDPAALDLIKRFYDDFWAQQFTMAFQQGYKEIYTVAIGTLNFINGIDKRSKPAVQKIIANTFIQQSTPFMQQHTGVKITWVEYQESNPYICAHIGEHHVGDMFHIPCKPETIILVAGDYGQMLGFNNPTSSASDEQTGRRCYTLGSLVPYIPPALIYSPF